MAKFLVTYHGGEALIDGAITPQHREAVAGWVAATGSAVVDAGAPVRTLTQLTTSEPQQRSEIDGYSVIEADTIEAAADLLRSHPFLTAGGTLQINEVLAG